MNAKESLLMAGVTLIGFGTTAVQTDLVNGLVLVLAGCLVLAFRGYMKEA